MKNKMDDMRNHLFEAMEMLKTGDMQVSQAKAMSEIGQTLINSAKLELEYMERLDMRYDSGFLQHEDAKPLGHPNVHRIGGQTG